MLSPVWFTMPYRFAPANALIKPRSLIVNHSLPRAQIDSEIVAARRYDTFWKTGNEELARAALAPNFIDRTFQSGRPERVAGPLADSQLMRAAIPDLSCEIEQMIVAGDRVVSHLRFSGHFTGQFGRVQGCGQKIDFMATDIYRIVFGRIVEIWRLEDKLTFQQQLGLISERGI